MGAFAKGRLQHILSYRWLLTQHTSKVIDYHDSTNFHEFSPDGKLRIYLYLLLESITFAFDKHFLQ